MITVIQTLNGKLFYDTKFLKQALATHTKKMVRALELFTLYSYSDNTATRSLLYVICLAVFLSVHEMKLVLEVDTRYFFFINNPMSSSRLCMLNQAWIGGAYDRASGSAKCRQGYSNARLGCHAFSFLLSFIVVLTTHLIRFVSCLRLVPAQGLSLFFQIFLIYSDLLYILVLFFVFTFNIYIYGLV